MENSFPKKLAAAAMIFTVLFISTLFIQIIYLDHSLKEMNSLHFPAVERNAINVRLNEKIAIGLEVVIAKKQVEDLDQITAEREALNASLESLKKILSQLKGFEKNISSLSRDHISTLEDHLFESILRKDFKSAEIALHDQTFQKAYHAFDESVRIVAERLSGERDRVLTGFLKMTAIYLSASLVLLGIVALFWWQVIVAYRFNLVQRAKAETALTEERARSVQQSKLASLGEMAGSVGHEINNPLAIITGVAEVMLMELQKENINKKRMIDQCMLIIKTALRISRIIKGLRNFCRDGSNDALSDCSVEEVIQDTLQLCAERCHSAGIELVLETVPTGLKMLCRATEVSQVILNLIGNSVDAIRTLPTPWIRVSAKRIENQIEIRVKDCGNGIPKEIVEKMMQPFYTSKPVGKGTGLGLSISKKLIENQHGSFFYDPSDTHTTFVMQIPVAVDSGVAEVLAGPAAQKPAVA